MTITKNINIYHHTVPDDKILKALEEIKALIIKNQTDTDLIKDQVAKLDTSEKALDKAVKDNTPKS